MKRPAIISLLLIVVLLLGGSPAMALDDPFYDSFSYPNGPISSSTSPWNISSGTWTASNGVATTSSPVFRAETDRADFQNYTVSFKLLISSFTPTGDSWDGIHIFLKHVDQYHLYYASVKRRDGTIVIKKKIPGGPNPSNGGTYYDLTSYATGSSLALNTWHTVAASAQNNANGTVTLKMYLNGVLKLTATDPGGQQPLDSEPITQPAQTGIRADNVTFSVDDFRVDPLLVPATKLVCPVVANPIVGQTVVCTYE